MFALSALAKGEISDSSKAGEALNHNRAAGLPTGANGTARSGTDSLSSGPPRRSGMYFIKIAKI